MAAPADPAARLFRRAAAARRTEADVLFAAGHGTGAVYLAGYAVECVMKALLLSATPRGERAEVMRSFKGTAGHDLDRLRERYTLAGGAWLPREVADAYNGVTRWGTNLRYSPAETSPQKAAEFLRDVGTICRWADVRL